MYEATQNLNIYCSKQEEHESITEIYSIVMVEYDRSEKYYFIFRRRWIVCMQGAKHDVDAKTKWSGCMDDSK